MSCSTRSSYGARSPAHSPAPDTDFPSAFEAPAAQVPQAQEVVETSDGERVIRLARPPSGKSSGTLFHGNGGSLRLPAIASVTSPRIGTGLVAQLSAMAARARANEAGRERRVGGLCVTRHATGRAAWLWGESSARIAVALARNAGRVLFLQSPFTSAADAGAQILVRPCGC